MKATTETLRIALALAQEGTVMLNTTPEISMNPQNQMVLRWKTPECDMEIQIRDDGKINWYRTKEGASTGTEGWVRYREGRNPWSDPWGYVA